MSQLSLEEKKKILLFVLENLLDRNSPEEEEKWKELGKEMNRDWKEIQDAYYQWKMDDEIKVELKFEETQENVDRIAQDAANFCAMEEFLENENDNAMDNFLPDMENNLLPNMNLDGQHLVVQNLDEFVANNLSGAEVIANIATLQTINGVDNNYYPETNQEMVVARKRNLELTDFELAVLQAYEGRNEEELELRRQEHMKKMEIYRVQLQNSTKCHKEKMNVLESKLRVLEKQVYQIDYAICNTKLHKKYRSGPI